MRNNIQVIDAIRSGKNKFSKKDVQEATGIAWGTMCKVVNTMLEDGIIFARKEKPYGRGRPMIPLCINSESVFFVGLDIGASQSKAVVCDLAFNTVYRNTIDTPEYRDETSFFTWLFHFYDDIIKESRVPRSKLRAVGMAVSGNVDYENGIIVSGGNFGIKWGANLPAAEKMSKHSGVPVFTSPTQTAAAWGEYHFGLRNGCANLVTIGLGVGIGSGVVSNHNLLMSQPGRPVGYIGHMLIPGNQHICSCGFRGCLESYSGGKYLAEEAAKQLPDRTDLHSAEALDQAASNGDSAAIKMMTTAASYNAVGIASMIQLYSPDSLIFYGGQCRKDGFLFNHTITALNDILPDERRQKFSVGISNLGKYQSALGAARLAYEKFF